MRLSEGLVIEVEETFGTLKYSALRREVYVHNEDGTASKQVKERTYDLKSDGQGMMIQVSIPAEVPLKEFEYNAVVEIVEPILDTVPSPTFQGADVDWYIKAKDIILRKQASDKPNKEQDTINVDKDQKGTDKNRQAK